MRARSAALLWLALLCGAAPDDRVVWYGDIAFSRRESR
jgi:hypothetical protein